MDLYEHIADDYDTVTDAAGRGQAAREMLAELRRRHPFESVLDVACGNGMHAMILAEMGASVTAVDISEAMLDQARRRADAAGLDVRWVHSPMQEIHDSDQGQGPFDAILCLGNSLPHLLDPRQLLQTMATFSLLVAPQGIVVLQLLNYARVLARRERIVGITRNGDTEYVRFYDFLEDLVRFNVLKLTWSADGCGHDLAHALLRPYKREEIAAVCRKVNLEQIEYYTGTNFTDFDEQNSDTLLLVAHPGWD